MEIELVDAVTALRDELINACQRGLGADVAFAVGPIDLEFTVELRLDAKAKAGFKAWVLSADAETGATRSHIHKVKIIVTPKAPNGTDLLISGFRPPGPGLEEPDTLER